MRVSGTSRRATKRSTWGFTPVRFFFFVFGRVLETTARDEGLINDCARAVGPTLLPFRFSVSPQGFDSKTQMTAKGVAARLSSKALSQEGFDIYRANRRWLQNAVSGFSLAPAERQHVKPHVLLYGSVVSGTALRDGDADFAVVFLGPVSHETAATPKESITEIKREEQETVLADLFQHISKKTSGEVLKPQRVFHARIPVVQYLRKLGNGDDIKFDVSLSVDGVKNSLLLRKYMQQFPRLHLGVLCVKQWGREARILNARRGWISPYALTIMYIHFMATTGRIPGLLDEAAVEEDVRRILRASADNTELLDQVPELNTALSVNDTDVEDVQHDVEDFFSFYGNESRFDFDASVVDIRKTGAVLQKEEWLARAADMTQADRWHMLGHEVIMVRDPYESHNLGRSVDFFRGEAIREAFRVASIKKEPLSFLSVS